MIEEAAERAEAEGRKTILPRHVQRLPGREELAEALAERSGKELIRIVAKLWNQNT